MRRRVPTRRRSRSVFQDGRTGGRGIVRRRQQRPTPRVGFHGRQERVFETSRRLTRVAKTGQSPLGNRTQRVIRPLLNGRQRHRERWHLYPMPLRWQSRNSRETPFFTVMNDSPPSCSVFSLPVPQTPVSSGSRKEKLLEKRANQIESFPECFKKWKHVNKVLSFLKTILTSYF